jgi:hypothetical protein
MPAQIPELPVMTGAELTETHLTPSEVQPFELAPITE